MAEIGEPRSKYLDLIYRCNSPGGVRNPIPLVRAVNALLPLGKNDAMSLLRTYCDFFEAKGDYPPSGASARAMHVARLLFVNKDGTGITRAPAIGSFLVEIPQDSREWPLFPLAVSGDIPFEVAMGVMLMGVAESARGYLDYLDDCCDLRPSPLRPADNPCLAADELLASEAWKEIRFQGEEEGRKWSQSEHWLAAIVRRQALCAVAHIYEPMEDIQASLSYHGHYAWADHLKRVAELKPRWDVEQQKYVSDR